MTLIFCIVIGILFGCGCYLVLRRSFIKTLLGILILSYGANFLIFVASGLKKGQLPLIADGARTLPEGGADPLPQALLLTAIVIGFGLQALFIVLCYRGSQLEGVDDTDLLSKEV